MQKISFIIFISLLVSCKKSTSTLTILEIESQKKVTSVSKKKISTLQSNQETLNLQGKIKSILCTNYQQFVPTSELSNLVTKVDYKFDERGNVLEEKKFLATGEISHYQYSYDDMGNLLKSVKLDQNDKKIVVATTLLNEKGFQLNSKSIELYKTKDYQDTIITFENITKYKILTDTVTDYISYGKSTPKDFIRSIDYYKEGNLIIHITKGKFKVISSFQYDKKNNKIKQTESYPNSESIARIYYYQYDKNNREIYWKIDSFDYNIKREIKRSYDDFGNITEEKQIENGRLDEKISYKYVYVYDQKNNWIRQARYKLNGNKVSILERKIIYY